MLVLGEPATSLVERYLGGEVDAREVDTHPVLSRWARAARLGLRADSEAHPEGTSNADLAVRRQRLETVFREESPLLAPIAEELSARGMMALVADPEGVILLSRGGGDFDREAERVRLVEGTSWSESARGTNAIGTAIAEGRSVAVVGAAHYEERNRGLFCYATPIVDAYGALVGVLDVTGHVQQHSPAVGIAVQAAGAALTRALKLREYAAATPGGYAIVERMLLRSSSPALLVEAGGAVLAMNDAARSALGVSDARGLTASRVFGASALSLRAMALSRRAHDAVFETRSARYRLELSPIFGPSGQLLSLLVYLDPERTAAAMKVEAAGLASGAIDAQGRGPGRGAGARVRAETPLPQVFDAILGTDPELVAAKRMAARFAPTPLPVLLLAETGTGKELFARATHAASARRAGPFVALNCGALAPSLLESELFGHAPGAFTGAQRGGSLGKLAASDGGTLFLDEIAEMPEALQATLLRVLEDGSYYRVGESRARTADFRLVCATCRDLPELVHAGRFRRDLFFRIQGACVTIPPLRARADRLVLARGLLARLAAEAGAACPELADDAVAWILEHDWPGNVRELKSALSHALVMAEGGDVIDAGCFPRVILRGATRMGASSVTGAGASAGASAEGRDAREGGKPSFVGGDSAARSRDAILGDAMEAALREAGGNVSEAARRLGVARSTLYRRVSPRGKGSG